MRGLVVLLGHGRPRAPFGRFTYAQSLGQQQQQQVFVLLEKPPSCTSLCTTTSLTVGEAQPWTTTKTKATTRLSHSDSRSDSILRQPPWSPTKATTQKVDNERRPRSDDDYVTNWMRLKDQILTTPLGRLTPCTWHQAQGLLQALRQPQLQPLSRHPMAWNVYSELIHNGFAILDRLSLEVQHDGRPTTTFSQRYPMLSVPVWSAPLLAWRDYVFVRIHHHNQQQPTNHLAGEEEFGSSFLHTDSDGAWIHNGSSEARFLDPFVMLSRMEDYQTVGLVEPHPCLYSIVLHALEKTTTVQRQQQQRQQPRNRMVSKGGADPCPYHRAHVEIYETMLHRSHGNPNHAQYHPDSSTIYHLIALWSHSGLPQAPERAEFYFQALEEWYRQCPQRSALRPTPLVYCALMETYSRHTYRSSALSSNDEDSTVVHAHTAFHRIQELYAELHQVFAPHELPAVTYNRACHAVAQCRHAQSATAARAILDEQCQRYLNDSTSSTTIRQSSSLAPGSSSPHHGAPASRFELTQVPFSIVISAYGHAGRVPEADALFEYLQELAQQTDNPQLQPGWITWNSLLWAHAQDTNQGSAQDVLVRLFQAWDAGQVGGGSSSSSSWMHNPEEVWSGIMASWALSNHPQAPEFLERVLDRLEQTVVPGKRPGLSTYLYNTLLTSYARQHSVAAAQKADALLQRMENSCVDHNPTNVSPLPPPDSNSYVNVLMAWINAGQPERSEECLKQLCRSQNHSSSHTDTQQGLLTAQHFNLVMDGWVKQLNRPDALDRAMAVMKGMTERGFVPDHYTYTSLMWAWAKSPTVQDPAPPVEHLYSLMMSKAHQQPQQQQSALVKPGAVTYNALLHAWARSPNPAAPNRVQALWNEIKRSGVRRNAKLYNTLMSFWSRRNRPTETEAVFQELIQEYHAHDNDDHQQQDALRPQGRSYNARLQVWSKAGHPEQTAKVLREWIAAYESGMVVDSLPSTKHFNAVLHAWLRSSDPQRASKAEAGLRQMSQLAHSTSLSLSSSTSSSSKRRLECRPDHRSYGSVITAYANSSQLPESGEKAFQLWYELNERFPHRTRSAKGRTDDKDDLHSMLRIHGQVFVALCRSFGRVDNSVPPDSAACLLVQRLHQVLDHVPAVIHCDKTTTRHSLTQMKNALQSIVLDHVQQEGLLVKLESLENTNKKKRGQG